ncbi:B3 domain-containing protein [Sesbania bispinosa]|nr:B3 domain-containing protein [Sesbania bispinosa]
MVLLLQIYIVKAFPDSVEEVGKDTLKEEGNMRATKATKAQKTASNPESGSNKTKKKKQAIVNETKESESFQEHLPESSIGNGVKPQKVNPTKKTKSSRKMEKKSKVPATAESKGEAQIETAKPKTAIKVSNKTRKSKECSVHEIGDSGNTEQPLAENNTVKPRGVNRGKKKESVQIQNADSEIKKVETVDIKKVDSGNTEQPLSENNTVKPRGANRGKKKESVQNADSGIQKVEPVGGASKSVSQTPRKKPAPKFFRKKA